MKMTKSASIALIALIYTLCVSDSSANEQSFAREREEFSAAMNAIGGNASEHSRDSRTLQAYVLYPYLEAARMLNSFGTSELDASQFSAAIDFLSKHRDTPIAESFRRELLLRLANLEAWPEFVAAYTADAANVTRECEYLSARVQLGQTDGLAQLIADRWVSPRRLPSACEAAFEWLRSEGTLDTALTEERVRMLLESGQGSFARIIARRLPDDRAIYYLSWADMLSQPLQTVDSAIETGAKPGNDTAFFAAWSALATDRPSEALARFAPLMTAIGANAQESSRFARTLALGLAWDRQPEALQLFASVAPGQLDDYALSWLIRAALWNGSWRVSADALDLMSNDERERSVWSYWLARTTEQLEGADNAHVLYQKILETDNFYSATAAARLGRLVIPNHVPLARNVEIQAALLRRPEVSRARELFALEQRLYATREWRYATNAMSEDEISQAAILAASWGWYDMAVAAATRAGQFNDYEMLYPDVYASEVAIAAKSNAVPAALINGVVRQESLFRPDAASGAGALGLMQLLPETARRTAQNAGLASPRRSDLHDPAQNIALGVATLRSWFDRFDQQLPVSLAAYNAGPNAAARWLPESAIDMDVWIENIPYNETREYVRRVLWHTVVYTWLEQGVGVDTRQFLSRVQKPTDALN